MVHKFSVQILAIAIGLSLLAASNYARGYRDFFNENAVVFGIVYFIMALFNVIATCLLLYLALVLPVSDLHNSTIDVISHFLTNIYYRFVSRHYWNRLARSCAAVKWEQENILKRILTDNKETEYGKKMKFCDMKSVKDFISKHPLTDYETFRPYVERMVAKSLSILTNICFKIVNQ